MKNDKKTIIGKKFGNNLIQQIYRTKEVLSVSIVGSFSKTYDLEKIGDLDVVIVCKKISNKIIKSAKKSIKQAYVKYPFIKRKLKINDTFGPVKYNASKYLIIHMMVYDVEGHIDHAINSPFTCYDWQRSNWVIGKKLKEIFPVENIYLRDFFEARRSSIEYLKDIKNNNISIRKYKINKKKISMIKENYKINKKNRGEFVYHIIYNLINNYNKFYSKKNIRISTNNFNKMFLMITKNNKLLLENFKNLKKQKISLSSIYSNKSIFIAEKFIRSFNLFIKQESKNYKRIVFLRHAKTLFSDKIFLGQGSNPDIIKKKIKINFIDNYDFIYSSPLKRAISTAKLFGNKKLKINNYLKEIDYGKAEGLTFKQYSKKFPGNARLWNNSIDVRFPLGENTLDIKKRVLKFIKIISKTKNLKTLVVTHNVFLRCLIGYYLNIEVKNYFKINTRYLQKFDFIVKENKIYPDIKRQDFKKLLIRLYD